MKKWASYLGLILLPTFFGIYFWKQYELKSNTKYTITTTIQQFRTLKSGLQIEHYYFVGGQKFVETFNKDERLEIKYPGGRYLLKYSKKYPSVSEVYWNKPVPDSLKQAPSQGWDSIPF